MNDIVLSNVAIELFLLFIFYTLKLTCHKKGNLWYFMVIFHFTSHQLASHCSIYFQNIYLTALITSSCDTDSWSTHKLCIIIH